MKSREFAKTNYRHMLNTTMEQIPSTSHELVETPAHRLITSIGWVEATWVNSTLVRHYNPHENYLQYNDGDTLHQLNVLDDDWDRLSELKYPWEYWPDLHQFGEDDFIKIIVANNAEYDLRPCNTKLRLFDDDRFNHVEHQLAPHKLQGIRVVPELWAKMFKGDFPIKYLPYIDRATREWAEKLNLV